MSKEWSNTLNQASTLVASQLMDLTNENRDELNANNYSTLRDDIIQLDAITEARNLR